MNKLEVMALLFVVVFSTTVSASVGYTNPNLPNIPIDTSRTTVTNEFNNNTNSSYCWQNNCNTSSYVLKTGDTMSGNLSFTDNQGLRWQDPDDQNTLFFGSYADGLAIRLVNALSAGGDFLVEPSDATFWRNTNSIWMGLVQGLYIGSGDPFMSASFVEMVFFDTQSNTTTFSAENSKVIVNGNVNSTRVTAQQFCNVTGSCINNWNYGIGDVTSSIGNATYLKIDGTNTMTSNFDGGLKNITNVSYLTGRNLKAGTNVIADTTSHVAGTNANASINSVAFGSNANATNGAFAFSCSAMNQAVCIGNGAIANATSTIFPGVAIGKNSIGVSSGVAIGNGAKALSAATVAIGTGAQAMQSNCVAIGGTTNCNTTIGVTIGVGLVNSETRSVQFGINSYSLKTNDTGVFFNNNNLSEITNITAKSIIGEKALIGGIQNNRTLVVSNATAYNTFVVDTINNTVGIGIAPQAPLHVSLDGTFVNTTMWASGTDNFIFSNGLSSAYMRLAQASSSGTASGGIFFVKARGTLVTPLANNAGDTLSTIASQGYDGKVRRLSTRVLAEVNGTPSDGTVTSASVPGSMRLQTANNDSGTLADGITIDAWQRVGIPQNLLVGANTTLTLGSTHVGQATCFLSGGMIGYCSDAVNSTGGCTCNNL